MTFRVLAVSLVMAALGCNSYDEQATEFECTTPADCMAPRTCQMGYCVLGGVDANTIDAALIDASTTDASTIDAAVFDAAMFDAVVADAAQMADATPPDAMMSPDAGLITVIRQIESDNNDAEEEISTGNMDVTSTDLELVFENASDQIVGMRFVGIGIPQGATIVSADIQFTVDETDSGATTVSFFAEDIDDAPAFVDIDFNISTRIQTSASVSWSPVAWGTVGEAGPDQLTPDLASVVQEVIDRGGWQSGNAIVLLVTGTGERTAEAFDGQPASAAVLTINYLMP